MTDDDASATPPPPASPLADALSISSDFGAAWAVLAALQVLTGRRTLRAASARLTSTGVASLVLTRALKHRFAVPRTAAAATTVVRSPTSTRFPSGHTLAAFLAACTIPRTGTGRAVGLLFAGLVGWSRVRVGHHRPVDVVAGAGVGALAGTALARILPVGS